MALILSVETEVAYTKGGKEYNKYHEEIITCVVCRENKTTMGGTKMCDPCYELDSRIRKNPMLVAKIMMGLSIEILKKDADKNYNTPYYDEPSWKELE